MARCDVAAFFAGFSGCLLVPATTCECLHDAPRTSRRAHQRFLVGHLACLVSASPAVSPSAAKVCQPNRNMIRHSSESPAPLPASDVTLLVKRKKFLLCQNSWRPLFAEPVDGAAGGTRMVDIADDRLAVRVPNAADEANNFVLGAQHCRLCCSSMTVAGSGLRKLWGWTSHGLLENACRRPRLPQVCFLAPIACLHQSTRMFHCQYADLCRCRCPMNVPLTTLADIDDPP